MSDPEPEAAPRPSGGEGTGRARRLGCTAVALALGLLLPELGLRWLLFGEDPLASSLGAELRNPGRFADPRLDTQYWTLRSALGMDAPQRNSENRHPLLGWRPRRLDPETLRHPDEAHLRGRRPLLLYGASYASCVTSHAQCFQGILEGSELGEEFVLLNYGCGGYGVDQVLLLMRETLDLYADLDPVVVVLLALDTDLERCSLDFRSLPKPRLGLVGEELVVRSEPEFLEPEAYLEANGIGITSYAWSLLMHAPEVPHQIRSAGRRLGVRQDGQLELIEAILAAMDEELVRRSLERLVVMTISPRGLPPSSPPPLEAQVQEFMEATGVPHLMAGEAIAEGLEAVDGDVSRLYFLEGPERYHPTPLGNQALFAAIARELRAGLPRGAGG